jgi:hypothetical protein
MDLTRGGRVQRTLTPADPSLQPLVSLPGGDALQEEVEWNQRHGVDGGRAPWPASQHLVNYRLNQVDNCSCDSYKYPPADGIQTPQSTCSSPLVKVMV